MALVTEVLVSNTVPTQLGGALALRGTIEINNYGPNNIWVADSVAGCVVGKCRRVSPQESYSLDLHSALKLYALAETATQATTAATVVVEIPNNV